MIKSTIQRFDIWLIHLDSTKGSEKNKIDPKKFGTVSKKLRIIMIPKTIATIYPKYSSINSGYSS